MITMQGESVPEAMLLDRLDEVLSLSGEDILERIGTGHISPSAYDTGFVARVSDPEGVPMFPETLDWLVVNQGRDGSWGSEVHHEYDRFINTLSAAIALKERGNHPEATAMAEAYLTEAIDRLEEADEGVTSDHLVAMLMDEARRVGLSVPYERNPHKLSNPIKRALLSYIYLDNGHPLGFFAEILGRVPNQKRLTRKLQMENGSLVSAPSTTAASIVFDPNPVMDHSYFNKLRFLQSSILPEGGVLHFWDMETMERVYGLYNLMHVSSHERLYIECADVLESLWGDNGLTYGRNFPVPDLDDTAIGYRVLTGLGREPDPRVFDHFWKDTFFSTWRVHNRGLPGPNLHALEALAHSSHPDRDGLIQSTIKFLRSNMIDGDHFVDEWHLSAAYATSHAIPAFHLTEEALMERCVSFFLDTQHEDGSWGFIDNGNGLGTLEETALALQGLLYYNRYVENIDLAPVSSGVEYILDRFPTVEHPKMWIAKVLIAPYNVIESSIVGALMMFRQAMTGSWNEEWRG